MKICKTRINQFPHVEKAHRYARSVVAGEIVACRWIILACKRHLSDLRKSNSSDDFAYRYDEQKAERVCKFIETFSHVKGKWAAKREKLILEPWQCFFVCSIFGWVHQDSGFRKYRQALLWVPRKNGKSMLAAAIGLYMLTADKECGAEVYSGATTEKQAWEVFRPAKLMAERQPEFLEYYGVSVNAKSIVTNEDVSRFNPMIGKPGDGASPSCAIIDEYHEHDTDEMVDTMQTGMGAREQPLLLMITTAGNNISGPCYQMQLDAEKILEGVIENDDTFALIYGLDTTDKWDDLEAIKKANPNYGVSISEAFVISRLTEAKNNARKQSVFQTKHLNKWVGAHNAYFNVEKWRACGDETLRIENFKGQRCYIGMDLASKTDVASLAILFPVGDEYVVFMRHYVPEQAVEDGINPNYELWMKQGYLTVTEGQVIDFARIREDVIALSSEVELVELAYDPYQATMLVTSLMSDGVTCIELRPLVLNFSEPMKTIDGLIRSQRIQHANDPVMNWMMSNVVATTDAKDNVYPRKERDENKIDGPVALIMAVNRALMNVQLEGSLNGWLNK